MTDIEHRPCLINIMYGFSMQTARIDHNFFTYYPPNKGDMIRTDKMDKPMVVYGVYKDYSQVSPYHTDKDGRGGEIFFVYVEPV